MATISFRARSRVLSPVSGTAIILLLSMLCFWPGIAMTDTITRWESALSIIGRIHVSWWGDRWLTPAMTISMIPFAAIGAWSFEVAQIAFLGLGAALWSSLSDRDRGYWVPAVFSIPIVFGFASFVVPDVWTLAGILCAVGAVFIAERGQSRAAIVLLYLSSVVLFGFRQNSIVVLPVLLVLISTRAEVRLRARAILASAVIAALLTVAAAPNLLGFDKRNSNATPMGWELVGMLAQAKKDGVAVEPMLTLDGIGNTDLAIDRYTPVQIDPLIWTDDAPMPREALISQPRMIRGKWARMIIQHPALYLKMKLGMYKCMMGLCETYLHIDIEDSQPPAEFAQDIGVFDDVQTTRGVVFRMINRISNDLKWLLLPVFWLPVSTLVFVSQWKRYSSVDKWMIAMAAAYLGSFFIFNQAASFRYLLPTYVIFTAYQIRAALAFSWSRRSQRRTDADESGNTSFGRG